MHFFGVFCQVHFEAKKLGMRGHDRPRRCRSCARSLRRDWPTPIPLVVLLIVLFSGFTPYLAAFWGITACIVAGPDATAIPSSPSAMLAAIAAAAGRGAAHRMAGPSRDPRHRHRSLRATTCCRDADGRARLIDVTDAFVIGRQVRDQRRRGGGDGGHHRRRRDADRRRLQALLHHHQRRWRSGGRFPAPSCPPCCSTPRG